MLRVTLSISALMAALLIAGAGSGVAVAEPEDPGGTGSTSEPGETAGDPPVAGEPTPAVEPQLTTATPPSIFDIPRNIATQLRDMMGRPLSVFGNGRVPGTHTLPDTPALGDATPGRKGDKFPVKQPEPTVPKPPVAPEPVQAPVRKPSNSSIDVTLPFSAPKISVPVPDLKVPGYESMRWTLNLSDPSAAYTSVGETLRTVNALLTDVYAPYNPIKPPPPKPSARIMEDGPVVDAGGTVDAIPLASGSELPVVQAPVLIPPIRLAPVRPMTGSLTDVSLPAASAPQALGTGPPAARAPAAREAVSQPGSAPPGQLPPRADSSPPSPSSSPMGNPVAREGYPQYLRSSRIAQVATVALPGLAGLIALTASGSMIGYRQANSGRYLRSGAERFLQ